MGVKTKTLKERVATMSKQVDLVVDTIIKHMDEGKAPWHCPYLVGGHRNMVSQKNYRGINQMVLGFVAASREYKSPYWATFNQIKAAGGRLENAKGKGVPILFYKSLGEQDGTENDLKQDDKPRFVARSSRVFNLDLVTGIDHDELSITPNEASTQKDAQNILEAYLKRTQINVIHGLPAYIPSLDIVRMLDLSQVESTAEYYSAFFHELVHSTGHPKRLNRFEANAATKESREDYSKEELVAEVGAAMLCHLAGVDSEASIKNSANYLRGWMKFIKDNKSAFASAVSQAQKATELMLGEANIAKVAA